MIALACGEHAAQVAGAPGRPCPAPAIARPAFAAVLATWRKLGTMRPVLVLAFVAAIIAPPAARASCAVFAGTGDQPLVNDATQIVLMRHGSRTVLTIQASYKGPAEAFAMIIPVPAGLDAAHVETLTRDVLSHVEQLAAPRLVELWEQDPCAAPIEDGGVAGARLDGGVMPATGDASAEQLGVEIESNVAAGEYRVVILSAKDASALDAWLRQENYRLPDGAEPVLRDYVERGMKLLVARIDPAKLTFENGRAVLSPLRLYFDAETLSLPIRLGLGSSGTRDLIVNILAPNQRYAVANRPNVTIPTNVDVRPAVRDRFAAFYTALYDATLAKHAGAAVTEYAWKATSCEPCAVPGLAAADLGALGADVLLGARDKPQPYQDTDLVLTRLHLRYGKDDTADLVFEPAGPLAGGRELREPGGGLERGARAADANAFQARYAIRHTWMGPLRCSNPRRGMWGPPTSDVLARPGFAPDGVKLALDLAVGPRGTVDLANVVAHDVPDIELHAGPPITEPPEPPPAAGSAGSASSGTTKKRPGCGCAATTRGDAVWGSVLVLATCVRRRRRHRS